jgi:hypothetical protein
MRVRPPAGRAWRSGVLRHKHDLPGTRLPVRALPGHVRSGRGRQSVTGFRVWLGYQVARAVVWAGERIAGKDALADYQRDLEAAAA